MYFKEFHVTGVNTRGKRFKIVARSWAYANAINLYRGHVWGVLESGKRIMLKEVYN